MYVRRAVLNIIHPAEKQPVMYEDASEYTAFGTLAYIKWTISMVPSFIYFVISTNSGEEVMTAVVAVFLGTFPSA
jgi:hypothetical protein